MRTLTEASLSKQTGASGLMILLCLAMAAVILTVAFKIYPAIYEQWQVETVVDSFEEESDLGNTSVREIENRFKKRLITNNVRQFNFDENVLISMQDETLTIEVAYESRVPVYKNIDAVVKFEKVLEVPY